MAQEQDRKGSGGVRIVIAFMLARIHTTNSDAVNDTAFRIIEAEYNCQMKRIDYDTDVVKHHACAMMAGLRPSANARSWSTKSVDISALASNRFRTSPSVRLVLSMCLCLNVPIYYEEIGKQAG